MRAAARKLLLIPLFLIAAFIPRARAADAESEPQLLAHGNSQILWVAEILPPQEPLARTARTVLRYRLVGDFANWRPTTEIPARAVQLSDRGRELIVLLENGEWMMVSESDARSGPSLPGQGDIVAIAGDAEAVWAVGEDRRPATTEPSTARTAVQATTKSVPSMTTSSAAAPPLALFSLERGQWVYQSPLPNAMKAPDVRAMVLLNHHPLLALVTADGVLRLY